MLPLTTSRYFVDSTDIARTNAEPSKRKMASDLFKAAHSTNVKPDKPRTVQINGFHSLVAALIVCLLYVILLLSSLLLLAWTHLLSFALHLSFSYICALTA